MQPNAYYESDRLLTEYAEFHFGDTWFGVENFPKALADLALDAMNGKPTGKALDLGCACGRSSFELARHFDQVEGVDFSANFIRLGVEMAEQGSIRYALAEEGELVSYHTRTLKELGLEECSENVSFYQGDACNLKPQYSGYDLVLAANLIDRLYRPRRFLDSIHERINDGGLLVIASPYTWLEEHTPKEEWIGGFKKDGENHTTLDGLKEHLSQHFRLVSQPRKVPFVIRETQHKFQHTLRGHPLFYRLVVHQLIEPVGGYLTARQAQQRPQHDVSVNVIATRVGAHAKRQKRYFCCRDWFILTVGDNVSITFITQTQSCFGSVIGEQ